MCGDAMTRTREFWRSNFYNEPVYTHARMEIRNSIAGGRKTLVNVGSHLGAEAMPYIQSGWRVFAFEPNPGLADELRRLEREHSNFTFLPKAVSANPGAKVEFFVSDKASGMSSLVRRDPSARSVSVEVTTLSAFCKEYDIDAIDYLLIDAELKDLEVFQSLDETTRLGAVTLEFGGNMLPRIHDHVIARRPDFENIVFEYRKPLGPDGAEMMGVAAKCVARSTVADYIEKAARGAAAGRWGNVLYFDPAL